MTDIATNTSGIATNVTDIATNTSGIATNVTDIATNTSGIATNVTDIATNTSGIATNVTDIATNTSGIATNVTDIATNTSGIATNVTDITTNTSGIATNVTDIATNTSGITTNVTDIATNTSGIATNVTDITTNTSGIATNVTDIATNTSGIATNVTDIATNTSGIATNVTDIATNTSGIATNVTDIATNTSGIATNVTDILARVETADIVDDLITGGTTVPLSAEQGKVLKGLVDTKITGNTSITAGTNTKITYDAKGLVTAGSAATTADIDASTDRNYVTDAEATVIDNTSGTNTGDQTAAEVVSTATGAIVATNVDSAIAELEAKKLALTGGEMNGNIIMNGTETVDGRDISVDGAKLDGIAAGAQVNVSGDSGNAAVYDNSGTPTLKSGITKTEIQTLINVEDGADVTDATNVLAAGAVMTTGDQTIAGAKTFSSTIVGDINGNAATATTLETARNIAGNAFDGSGNITIAAADLSDVTDAGSGSIISTAERTKLTNIETSADVTDATNVLAAGAVMTTGDQTIAGAKTFSSTIVGDINGNAATATTLETARNIAGNAFDGSGNITIAAADLSDVTDAGSGSIISTAERTKLTNIETSADVTDATNVLAAGAVMTTGDQTIAGAKTFSSTIVGDINGNAATATTLETARNIAGNAFDGSGNITIAAADLSDVTDAGSGSIISTAERTKLTNIETSADVTDATNVLAAGAVMTTGDQTIAGAKTFSSTIVGDINGNAATATTLETARNIAGNAFDGSGNITIAAADLSDVTDAGSGSIISTAERTKLTNIETSADVTDATNVLAAGAVMTTGDQTIAGAKTFSSTIVGDINGNAATATTLETARNIAGNAFDGSGNITIAAADLSDVTDAGSGSIISTAERTKLTNIETSADVTDATNVLAAGAVMTTGDQTIAGAKTFSSTIVGDINGNAATATTLETARNIAGNAFDGSGNITIAAADLSDVTDAGSGSIISTAERTKLTNIETSADVTDATNVLAAGAVMTTGDQTIAGAKTFSSTIVGDINGNAATATTLETARNIAGNAFDGSGNITIAAADLSDVTDAGSGSIISTAERTKLTNIETSADVTDATNVLAAGAVMTTGDQTIAGAKTFSSTIVGDINGNAATATTLETARNIAGNAFDGSGNITIAAADLSDVTDAGSGSIISTAERTKLTNIETSADVTDATNVLAAGAVMTTGDQTIAGAKTFSSTIVGDINGNAATATTLETARNIAGNAFDGSGNITIAAADLSDVTDAGSGSIISTAERTKLTNIETSADVTDATNVLAAGAVMTTGDQTIAGAKTFSSTIVGDINGNAATATTLETARNIAGNAFDGSGNITIAAADLSDVTDAGSGSIISTAERTKLTNIETSADVTDATNVLAAGAVMTTGDQTIAGAKTFSSTIVGDINGNAATATTLETARNIAGNAFDGSGNITIAAADLSDVTDAGSGSIISTAERTKLTNIETSADVTDATNVLAAGAVMTTGDQTIAGAKTFSSTIVGDINGNAATATTLETARNIAGNAFDGSGNITIAAADLSDVTDAGSGSIISTAERTKLTNIETSADVTDATNVLAAGAVMTTGDQTIAGAKTFSSTIVGDINGNAATATTLETARNIAGNAFDGSGNITIAAADLSDVTDAGSGSIISTAERTKLTNIETSADVTDATNVLAAGAVMTTGDQTIAGAKTFSSTIVGDINGNAATATTLETARNIAGNAFDGSGNITIAAADLSDVTDAGSGSIISTAERTKLTNIETSADVTDATNVLAAGAVMTTGDQTIAGAKTFSSTIVGDINGNAATATTLETARNIAGNAFDGSGNITIAAADLSDVTDAGSGSIISTAERTKLTNIETSADVTDATNVLAAGAVMTTGDQTIAGAKTFSSTIVGDINGNAATATTLETARNIAGNAFDGSGNITIAAADLSDVTDAGSGSIISTAERTKLTNIETSADVTDATNVLAAGAVMTTGDQTIAGAKTFSSTIVGDINGNAATATTLETARNIAGNAFDGSGNITIAAADLSDVTDAGSGSIISTAERTKLTNIETSADVTDATNVLAAGAVMTTGDQTIAGAKTFSSTIVGDINGNAATATTLETARNIAGNAFDGSGNITIAAADLSDVTDAGSGSIISTAERTKLTNIETSADVTDATNVLAAGAVMTTGDQTIAGAKTFSSTIVGDINGNAATATTLETARNIAGNAFDGSGNITIAAADLSDVTDAGSGSIISTAERTKLTNIETSADVTDATNVLAAGAVMTTGDQTIAGAKTFSSTIVGDINGNAATATTLETARNIAGNAFDGSGNITIAAADLSDVTDAGSGSIISTAERTKLTNIETSADVTDATNVLAAGAVMTTGDQTIAGIKTFSSTIVSDLNGNILDSNGNELVKGTATASAVNEITITNAATTNGPTISASGDDTNVDLNLEAKGTGVVNTSGALNVGGTLDVTGVTTLTGDLISNGGDITNATAANANNIFATSTGKTTLGGGAVDLGASGSATTVKGTLNIDEAVTLDTTLDVTGDTNLNSTTTSTSSTTGALIVDGGVGIAENLNVGGAIDVTDAATTRNNLGILSGKHTWVGTTDTNTFTVSGVTANSIITVNKSSTSSAVINFVSPSTDNITIKMNNIIAPGLTFNYIVVIIP